MGIRYIRERRLACDRNREKTPNVNDGLVIGSAQLAMNRETYIQIARQLNDIDRLFEKEAVGNFALLEEWEPTLAILATAKLGGRESAARWVGKFILAD